MSSLVTQDLRGSSQLLTLQETVEEDSPWVSGACLLHKAAWPPPETGIEKGSLLRDQWTPSCLSEGSGISCGPLSHGCLSGWCRIPGLVCLPVLILHTFLFLMFLSVFIFIMQSLGELVGGAVNDQGSLGTFLATKNFPGIWLLISQS